MFKFFKRASAAAEVKQYTAHWCAAMTSSMRSFLKGYNINDRGLRMVSVGVIIASIMQTNASSARLMTAIFDQINRTYGFGEEEFKGCILIGRSILHGVNDSGKHQAQLSLLNEICPEYEFTIFDTDWFETNLGIIVEVLETTLYQSVYMLK